MNSILDSHQLIVDIVAFVSKGDFPRSRLGEKQRGKILASWVTRKMRTIAQFSIRDGDGADSQITEVAEPRSGLGSVVGVGSSLRNVETVTSPPADEVHALGGDYTTLPTGISEMPATYESSIVESPPLPQEEDRDDTPTEPRSHHDIDYLTSGPPFSHDTGFDDYDPHNENYLDEHEQAELAPERTHNLHLTNTTGSSPEHHPEYEAYTAGGHASDEGATPQNIADASTFNFTPDPPPPVARYDNKPILSTQGRESLPSQQRYSSSNYASHYSNNNGLTDSSGSGGGGLRIANQDPEDDEEEADDWRKEALMQMNLAKDDSRTGSREGRVGDRGGFVGGEYGGGGYGHAM